MSEVEKCERPAIKVPFLPIEDFDSSEVTKNFRDLENPNESKNGLTPVVNLNNRGSLQEDLLLILTGMGMEKYIEVFKDLNITLHVFLQLNEKDLEELGIIDSNDREIIVKNLNVHNPTKAELIIPYKQTEYLKIIRNVAVQLKVIQKYCEYFDFRLSKVTLSDYIINAEESAGTYLKAFTECAKIQSNILKLAVHDEKTVDCLINQTLRINQLVLPLALQKKLQGKRNKKRTKWKYDAVKVLTVVSLLSLVFLSGKYLFNSVKVH